MSDPTDAAPPAEPRDVAVPPSASVPAASSSRAWIVLAVLLIVLCVVALLLAWRAEQRVANLEQELVRRQQDSANQADEARMLAKQSQDGVRDALAKVAILEARVAEVAVQRTQLEDLIQSLSRSRDENLLVDIEAAIRMALQQGAITGSAEPLVLALRQSDERLARYSQPRLEGVRRAIARDLERVKAVGVTDIATLTIRLDEVMRGVDELPLLAVAEPRVDMRRAARPARAAEAASAAPAASAASAPAGAPWTWPAQWTEAWRGVAESIWAELRSLVRVTTIDRPEAVLLAPEQSYFLRENLKLRLLNARLSLLSRQFPTAQADLALAQNLIERYFDRGSRRTGAAQDLLRQIALQARQINLPRPDDTLAALTAAAAGR